MEINKKEYDEYVKVVTPLNNLWADMGKAFLVGGAICTVGQALNSFFSSRGAGEEVAAAWTILCLIALSVILTGFNLYPLSLIHIWTSGKKRGKIHELRGSGELFS